MFNLKKPTKCILSSLILSMVILGFIICQNYVKASNINTIESQIDFNNNNISHLEHTKEQLHIVANCFRSDYLYDEDFVDSLGERWMQLDDMIGTLHTNNTELYEKLEEIKNRRFYLGVFELTAYCYGNRTATGTVPTANRTIAVDPKVIPYGTKVEIEGYGTYIAEDTGGAIKGNIIDIYIPGYQNCINFGRRKANVYIVE